MKLQTPEQTKNELKTPAAAPAALATPAAPAAIPVTFQTTTATHRGNATRENAAARQARMNQLIDGATFIGAVGLQNARLLVEGKTLKLGNTEFSLANGVMKCKACGGVNGLRDKNISLLASVTAWQDKDGNLFFISNSCRVTYFEHQLNKLKAGLANYRSLYPKAPVKASA